MLENHEHLPLPPDAESALAEVIRRDVALAVDSLQKAGIREPVAAICLYSDQPESFALPDLYVMRADGHPRSDVDDWADHWLPDEDHDVWVEVPLLDDDEFVIAERTLEDALDGRVVDPFGWGLLRVAQQLNRQSLPVDLSQDGLAFVLNHDPSDEFVQQLRFVAPPDVFDRLRARGLIGR